MIPCKRASHCADVLVVIYRYEGWQFVRFKALSPNNVNAIAWCNDYQFANIQYTIYLLQILLYNDGSAQDCSNSISNALELLQSCTKPSIYFTCKVFPLYYWSFLLVLLPPHHIQNIYQTYDSNSVVVEKNGWNNADGFWQMQIF